MTVRQVFYQLVVRNAIEKTEKSYKGTVVRLLTEMRMSGDIPFEWIIDESRRTRQHQTRDSVTDASTTSVVVVSRPSPLQLIPIAQPLLSTRSGAPR
jgi:hypothetical protein